MTTVAVTAASCGWTQFHMLYVSWCCINKHHNHMDSPDSHKRINSVNVIVDFSVFYWTYLYVIEVFKFLLLMPMKIQVKSKQIRKNFWCFNFCGPSYEPTNRGSGLSDSASCALVPNYIYIYIYIYIYKTCKVTKTINQYCMKNTYAYI